MNGAMRKVPCVRLLLWLVASSWLSTGALAQQTPPAAWAGWARCEITVQGPGYTDQQTHTWTIAGGAPTNQGAFQIYPGTWAVVGGGSLSRTQGAQTLRAQWATNAPDISAPIAVFVRASDNRMFIQARHAQLRGTAAIQGFQQLTINGVPKTPGRISAEAFEWAFPVIAVSAPVPPATNATATGSSNSPVTGSVGVMQPAGSQGTASCTWQFGQGSAAPTPPPTLTAQAIPTANNPPATSTPTGSSTPPSSSPATTTMPTNPPGSSTPPASSARLISVSPTTMEQGATGTVLTLTGQGTHWLQTQPTITVAPDIGVPVTQFQAASDTELLAQLDVQYAATPGPRMITVTAGSEVVSLPNAFTVTARARPELVSVTPNRARQGEQNLTVQLTGRNTRWAQGATRVRIARPVDGSQPGVSAPLPGVTVLTTTVHSPTRASAVINVEANAVIGSYWFNVFDTAPSDWLRIVDGFTVETGTGSSPATGRLVSVAPASIEQGVSPSDVITLTGEGTHWQQGTTTVNFGPGITVQNGVRVSSPTSLTAQLSVAYAAAQGPRAISVTTGNEIVTLPNALTIVAREQPAITQISPNSALAGVQNVTVSFTGRGTRWEQGRTALVLNNAPGLTQAGPVSVSSSTSMMVSLNIAASAAPGPREITVLNSGIVVGSDIITVADGFTVNSPASPLTVTPLNPALLPTPVLCLLRGPGLIPSNPSYASPGGALLHWSTVTGATSYTVSRSDLGVLTSQPHFDGGMSFKHHALLPHPRTYVYTITAQYPQGCGSTDVTLTSRAPWTPNISHMTDGAGRVRLSWDSITVSDRADFNGILVTGPALPPSGRAIRHGNPGQSREIVITGVPAGSRTWTLKAYWDAPEGRLMDDTGRTVTVMVP